MEIDPTIQTQATRMLTRWTNDTSHDPAELSALLYDEMRSLARLMMNNERNNHTLEPTALVNEAFVRLINAQELDIQSRDHFFMLASRVMRNILVDHARSASRLKRGGDRQRISITIADPSTDSPIDPADLLAIDEALDQLRSLDERKAQIIELRFFGGLDEETSARILGISRSTASSDWRFARAWLLSKLSDQPASPARDQNER